MKNLILGATILLFSATMAIADGPGRYNDEDCHKHRTGKTYLHKKDGEKCNAPPVTDVNKILKRIEKKVDSLSMKIEGMVIFPTPGTKQAERISIKQKSCETLSKQYENTAVWNRDKAFKRMQEAKCFE